MIAVSLTAFGLTGCPGNATNSNGGANANGRTANSNTAVVINSNTNMMNSNMTNSNMNMSNSTSGVKSVNDFMTEAAQGGMAEVELSRMAQTKAQNADVKKFAQKMVQDHTNANNELKGVATKKTVTLPTDVGAMHKAAMDKLKGMSGADFDKEYVAEMVKDHEKDVADFQKQADGATDADVKAFAAKTLPTLKMHLEMIKDIQGKMK